MHMEATFLVDLCYALVIVGLVFFLGRGIELSVLSIACHAKILAAANAIPPCFAYFTHVAFVPWIVVCFACYCLANNFAGEASAVPRAVNDVVWGLAIVNLFFF